jgi:phosphate transport system protein
LNNDREKDRQEAPKLIKRKEFDSSLKELRQRIIDMGKEAENALKSSIEALKNQDEESAKRIIDYDQNINVMEENIVELGSKLIATQQPVAKDLRTILVAFKIANDLERMADLSVDIAKVVLRMKAEPLMKPLVDIPKIAEMTQLMINDSIRAYVDENVDLAYKTAKIDDEVDYLYSQILRELFSLMAENPKTVNQGILLSFVGRYIERIADHATNIGESVVYLVTGKRTDLNQ